MTLSACSSLSHLTSSHLTSMARRQFTTYEKRLQDLLIKKIKRFLDKIEYFETTNIHLEDAMSEFGFENDQLDT